MINIIPTHFRLFRPVSPGQLNFFPIPPCCEIETMTTSAPSMSSPYYLSLSSNLFPVCFGIYLFYFTLWFPTFWLYYSQVVFSMCVLALPASFLHVFFFSQSIPCSASYHLEGWSTAFYLMYCQSFLTQMFHIPTYPAATLLVYPCFSSLPNFPIVEAYLFFTLSKCVHRMSIVLILGSLASRHAGSICIRKDGQYR